MGTAKHVISTDWHIKPSNTEEVKGLIKQQIKLAQELNVTSHICLGDVFQSRQAQPIVVLNAFQDILEMFETAQHTLTIISGNHDKTDYKSEYSFLFPFKGHKCLVLVEGYRHFKRDNFHFIPFFSNNEWITYFEQIKEKSGILFSHIAVEGSVNNDGSSVESSLKPSMFKDFDKVFLGHYHNQQQIGENIYHLPSLQANNFGEDNLKGFTVLNSDGTHELVKAKFKEFKTVKVNLDEVSKKELNVLKKKHANSTDNVRFKFVGDESKLKSIAKNEFTSLGIDVVSQATETEYEEVIEIKQFTKSTIAQEFKTWCEKEEKDYEQGVKYLQKIL